VVLPIWATVWTGCGPWLPLLGAKNRTELDLKTLASRLANTFIPSNSHFIPEPGDPLISSSSASQISSNSPSILPQVSTFPTAIVPRKGVVTKKKYKPVALKVKPVIAKLPDKFRIVQNILGDPLADIPVLDPHPPPFKPTG
jgi:hypothetical protein